MGVFDHLRICISYDAVREAPAEQRPKSQNRARRQDIRWTTDLLTYDNLTNKNNAASETLFNNLKSVMYCFTAAAAARVPIPEDAQISSYSDRKGS
jgi:hypothetical protein